jgi:sugar/nucleoside kinase (ribokinase family)
VNEAGSGAIQYATHSVIVDDLVFPDGRTAMGLLGGSGPQTAFGMRLWADGVGLCGARGGGFPAGALAWLDAMGIDHGGLLDFPEWPCLRAWQITEWDGRRVQVWRSERAAVAAQQPLRFERIPPAYLGARGFWYGVHPESPNLDPARRLRALGMTVGLEVFRSAKRPLADAEVRALASAAHILSPNLREAETMLGAAPPEEQARRLNDAGATVVALRMGAAGTLLRRADTGETVHVPPFPAAVVDATGAGNAFGGGLLVGWVETGDLRTAGRYGAVAASFLVEQVGLPPPGPDYRAEARRRLAAL